MVASGYSTERRGTFDPEELRAFQMELVSLEAEPQHYPFEYSLGSLQLLFESRDDIQVLVDNLAVALSELGRS